MIAFILLIYFECLFRVDGEKVVFGVVCILIYSWKILYYRNGLINNK